MNWRLLFANSWRLAPAMMPASPVSARYKSYGSRDLNRLLTSGSSSSGPDDKETVEVQRRRRTKSTGPRRRADAPNANTTMAAAAPRLLAARAAQVADPAHRAARRVSPWPADGWRRS